MKSHDAGDDDPIADVFDVRRDVSAKTEFASFLDFQAGAGHLFSPELHESIWNTALEWLHQASRNPRVEDLLMANHYLTHPTTEDKLRARGLTNRIIP